MELIDDAYRKFEELIIEVEGYSSTILTEQDTRFKIINHVLTRILGYTDADIYTETPSGARFIDYQVKVKDIGRLIIEAKKEAIDFNMDESRNGRAFNLDGAIFKDKEIQEGLHQTIYYAAHEGIELACLTNGQTWLVFRANRGTEGVKVMQGKGIIFSSLQGIKKEFKLFYDLLSPQSLSDLKYKAIFQELEGQQIRTKDFAESLKTADNLRLYTGGEHSPEFDRVMTTFFSKLAGDDDPEFLINCFVETKESQTAELQISRISEDLINRIRSIETVEGDAIREVIERIKLTKRQEFIILVGGKGAGKSTFVERFFNYVLTSNLKDDCVIVRVDVGGYKGSDLDIVQWLDNTLLEQCERTLYNGAPTTEEIQGIFYDEYQRLRIGPWREQYNKDKIQFKIEFGKHIENRRETRPTEYIQKLVGNIVKSRRKIPCIIFDNADHFSIEIQEKVFQYGRAIYNNEICLVIVPITDKTSWQLSKQGAIRSYENEVFFLPTPLPKKVIEKRIEYLDRKVQHEKVQKGRYFFNKGIKLEISDIEGFVRYLQLVFLHDNLVSKWIGSLSNYDIRTSLEITRDLIASPHLSMVEYLKAFYSQNGVITSDEFSLKPFRIKNALIKRGYQSYPVGHHPYVQNLFYCTGDINTTPLLAVRILQLLTDRKSDRSASDAFLPVTQIQDYFNAAGIERSVVRKHLQFLLTKGLVSSYDPSIVDVDYSQSVELTPSGNEHYFWCLNDIDYLHLMLEVTPISDRAFFRELSEKYYRWGSKLALTLRFYTYLEQEDKIYCRFPNHISYEGQKFIFKRFSWQQQVISKKLRGGNDTKFPEKQKMPFPKGKKFGEENRI